MKRIAYCLIACAIATSSALAGERIVSSGKESKEAPPMAVPCFKDQELQLDIFGSFTWPNRGAREVFDEGAGGGLGVNYFFLRYVGFGVDANVFDGHVDGVWDFAGNLIFRYPVDLGHFCFAPYAFGGGGLRTTGDDDHHFNDGRGHHTRGTWDAGAGVEFRITPRIGVFTDGRYTWAEDTQDAVQTRVGVRFVF